MFSEPVGNLAAQIFSLCGYNVTAIDPVESRRQLALSHGLTGEIVVMPGEDLSAYQQHLKTFTDDLQPVGAIEANVQTQVDTVATHLGEVVSDTQIQAIPLNGRNYTDLLAIQPGVSPVTTLTPTSVIMAGVTGTINPSGDANAGDVSIDGQRESANGFMVNAVDVQEHMNGGTSVIPNLDSIQEFRVLTNNFDSEYGNYNGGMINVVTNSGSNSFHGDAFEFLRNTDLDARNFFDNTRGILRPDLGRGSMQDGLFKLRLSQRAERIDFPPRTNSRTTQDVPLTLILASHPARPNWKRSSHAGF